MNKSTPSKSLGAYDAASEALLLSAACQAIEFRRSLNERPQKPEKTYAEMRRAFAATLPEASTDHAAVLQELASVANLGLSTMAGPRFFGFVVGGSHPVGIAADWLTSAWGQNASGHTPTPAAAACEETAAQWLLDLLGLPSDCSVGFVTGATAANFTCLAAARGEVLHRVGWDVENHGLFGAPPIRVILGDDAHTSVFAALQYLGLGRDRVTRIAADAMGRMQIGALADAIKTGEGPTIVITQAGHINTGAFDPIGEIAEIAHRRGAWVHVDGAFGLWARACPEMAYLAAGCEAADSWASDGHKWLQTPYDCGYAIVRDEPAHRRAMSITASYLAAAAPGERKPADYTPELSRRARGFATWAMIRALGREGIAQMIAGHCKLARRMAETLATEPGVAILNDVELNQVAVRFGADGSLERGDTLTRRVIEIIQDNGICYAGGAQWKGKWIMRLSVIAWCTTEADADRSTKAIIEAFRQAQKE